MADLDRPHVARIVDYWLGGSHHYSIDRETAKLIEQDVPDMPVFQRAHRKFLKRAYAYLILAQQLDKFVDFGSGLPTQGNVHEIALDFDPDAKVIYSDNDPEVVRYGQEIIAASCPEQTRYVYCDAAHPEELLESEVITRFLEGERRVGIGFSNLPHLIPNADLSSAFRTIYEWVAPGSHMVVSWGTDEVHKYPRVFEVQDRYGTTRWYRPDAEILELLGPWDATEHGVAYSALWPKQREPSRAFLHIHRCLIAYKQS